MSSSSSNSSALLLDRIHRCIRLLIGYPESTSLFESENDMIDSPWSGMTVWELIKTKLSQQDPNADPQHLTPVANRLDAALGVLRIQNYEKARSNIEQAKDQLMNLLGMGDGSSTLSGQIGGHASLEIRFLTARLEVFCCLYLSNFFFLEPPTVPSLESPSDRESIAFAPRASFSSVVTTTASTATSIVPSNYYALEALHHDLLDLCTQINSWSEVAQAINIEFTGSIRPVYRLAAYKRHRLHIMSELASLKATVVELVQSRPVPPPAPRVTSTAAPSSSGRSTASVCSSRSRSTSPVPMSRSANTGINNIPNRSRPSSRSSSPTPSHRSGVSTTSHGHGHGHHNHHNPPPQIGTLVYIPQPRLTHSWKDILQDANKEVDLSLLEPQKVTISAQVINASFTTDQYLFVGTFDHILAIYDISSLTLLKTLQTEQSNIDCFTYYPRMDRLFVGLSNGKIMVIDILTLEIAWILSDHTWSIRSLKLLYDRRKNVTGSAATPATPPAASPASAAPTVGGNTQQGEEVSDDELNDEIDSQGDVIGTDRLISASLDKTIRIYDAQSLACLTVLKRYGENDNFSDIAIILRPIYGGAEESDRLFAGLSNGGIAMWDLSNYQYLGTLYDASLSTGTTTSSSTVETLQSSSNSTSIKTDSKKVMPAGDTSAYIVTLSLYQNRYLYAATYDGYIKIWDTKVLQCIHTIRLGRDIAAPKDAPVALERPSIMRIAQNRVWVGCESGRIQAFDAISWNLSYNSTTAHSQRITGLAIVSDKLCTTAMDCTIRIMNIETPVKTIVITCDKAVMTLTVSNGRLYSGGRTIRSILL